jgi:GNAT superfamily N-acetyltransferase
VELVTDAHRVPGVARQWLDANGVFASVPASILAGELSGERHYDDQSWALVSGGDGRFVGLAVQTAPYTALVPPIGSAAAVAVARAWYRAGRVLPGVLGDAESGGSFVRAWEELAGVSPVLALREGVHVLGEFAPAEGVRGSGRPAEEGDLDLVVSWVEAFVAEVHAAGGERVDREEEAERIRRGRYLLWEDGNGPVSLAGVRDPAGGYGRIGPVYTPPEHRGRGYAAAVTTLAVRSFLQSGARPMLHTDLANPTSNGVYARLGFERVGELNLWEFTP